MHTLLSNIKLQINPKVYIKDPETSVLGRRIVRESIVLIDEVGFDNFTFKKLGERISSNESSIYRYFENKHKLLIYLSGWYWAWMEYRMVFATANIADPVEKLRKAIVVLTEKVQNDTANDYVNELVLNRIIIAEFTKTFLTKEVDAENREGFFLIYKRVVNTLREMIIAVNPDLNFGKCLASSIIEGSLHQHFLKDHFTTITDCNEEISPTDFYLHLITHLIK